MTFISSLLWNSYKFRRAFRITIIVLLLLVSITSRQSIILTSDAPMVRDELVILGMMSFVILPLMMYTRHCFAVLVVRTQPAPACRMRTLCCVFLVLWSFRRRLGRFLLLYVMSRETRNLSHHFSLMVIAMHCLFPLAYLTLSCIK